MDYYMDIAISSLSKGSEFKIYPFMMGSEGQVSGRITTGPFNHARVAEEDNYYPLVVHGWVGDNQLEKVTLHVNSALLVNVFREVIGTYPTLPTDFSSPFTLESPFHILFHHWVDLDLRRRSTEDNDEHEHLDLLFDFMNRQVGPERKRMLAMTSQNQISFSNAWTIFRPGDLVYKECMGHPWLLMCQKTAYEENEKDGKFLQIHCTYTDIDGVEVGEARTVVTIYQKQSFGANNPTVITDLPVYPCRYFEEHRDLERRLTERGKIFLGICNGTVKAYNGQAQYLRESSSIPHIFSSAVAWVPYTEQGRIILDQKTFQEDHYSSCVRVQVKEEPDSRLCPPYVVGFSLSRKGWCRFFIDNFCEVNWKEDHWQSLVIPHSEKLILRSLVTSHTFTEDPRDQMQQKGRGLVILLHGTPGSGKTFTAETAAEATKRALIVTSLSELNSYSSSFEQRLSLLLRYATIWKAMVVMDGTDELLEAHDSSQIWTSRNGVEAAFLRQLEYFGGILFLTANPIKSFDLAMESRIHLAIEYHPTDRGTREVLWDHMLSAVPEEEHSIDIDDARQNLGGIILTVRQIANAIHTARTIARFENAKLNTRHLEMVLFYWAESHQDEWLAGNIERPDESPIEHEHFFHYPWAGN